MLGAVVMLPIGLLLLTRMPAEFYRYLVSICTLIALVLIVSGVRYRGHLSRTMIVATGGAGGFLGGVAGLPGPPAIVMYFASTLPIATIRANLMLYLLGIDLLIIPILALHGALALTPMLIGLIAVPIYMIGGLIGARLFDPARERPFRLAAYGIIAFSAVSGLPFIIG